MNKLEISLESIAQQIQDENPKYTTLQDVLDEIYGIALNATNFVSLMSGNINIHDIFKNFKPSVVLNKFMPKKYLNVSKETAAIYKYEKLAIANLSIILVSFNQALQENEDDVKLLVDGFSSDHTGAKRKLSSSELERLYSFDYEILKEECLIPEPYNNQNTIKYIDKLLSIFKLALLGTTKEYIITKIQNATLKYYNINLLEIMTEFSEMKLWINLEFQKEILDKNSKAIHLLEEIREYQNNQFNNEIGLKDMNKLLKENSNTQLRALKDILDKEVHDYIMTHHNVIRSIVENKIFDIDDIIDLNLPKVKDMYIPQSYKYFYYKEKQYKTTYLDKKNWSKTDYLNGENIGKEVFQALRNPYNLNKPILILGNPGSGKSMFSSLFAYKLIDNNEFVPLYIKLRHVDSTTSDIDTHINQGLKNTLSGGPNIDWAKWVKQFPDKIPVIILDGFDELLKTKQVHLHDYVMNIQKLQNMAQYSGLNIRVILTSRLTVMNDVKIPENCLVIKLNNFDKQRKKLWVQKWNEKQLKTKQFILPIRDDINELSKEPLLLFLLALYDFEDNALVSVVKEGLNQSLLYHKLFEAFAIRQLKKDNLYNTANIEKKIKMENDFRLRIGFFALILFLHNEIDHSEKDFDIELDEFKLSDNNKAKKIIDGFFFIHKDISTDNSNQLNANFEFLHKTFGEFLASDFMLRISYFRANDDKNISYLSNQTYFRQVFAFQWIHKSPKTLDFIMEYSSNIIDTNSSLKLINIIKIELDNLLNTENKIKLPKKLHKLNRFEKLKHIAIYSQNLLLIWISLQGKEFEFEFKISDTLDNIQSWKIFVDLWKNYGSLEHVSYLVNYINIKIKDNNLIITSPLLSSKNYSEFSKYTHISYSPQETALSYHQSDFILQDVSNLYNLDDKDISLTTANMIITRLDYIYKENRNYLNEDIFNRLWKSIDFSNQIKLFDFYTQKNIYFDLEEGISILLHGFQNGGLYNISQKLKIIEMASITSNAYKRIKTVVRAIYSNLKHSKDTHITLRDKLKFIEIFFEHEDDMKFANKLLLEIYQEIENKKILSIQEKLKLIKLSLKFKELQEYRDKLYDELYNHIISHQYITISDLLKIIKLLKVHCNKKYSTKLLNRLIVKHKNNRGNV